MEALWIVLKKVAVQTYLLTSSLVAIYILSNLRNTYASYNNESGIYTGYRLSGSVLRANSKLARTVFRDLLYADD